MQPKVTHWFWAGVLLLIAGFVLAHIVLFFYSRSQVSYIGSGISATDFAAPYFFVINRGAMLGLLLAIGTLGYGRLRLLLAAGAAQSAITSATFLRFMLLFAPVLMAVATALTLAIYLQQVDSTFSRYDYLLQP